MVQQNYVVYFSIHNGLIAAIGRPRFLNANIFRTVFLVPSEEGMKQMHAMRFVNMHWKTLSSVVASPSCCSCWHVCLPLKMTCVTFSVNRFTTVAPNSFNLFSTATLVFIPEECTSTNAHTEDRQRRLPYHTNKTKQRRNTFEIRRTCENRSPAQQQRTQKDTKPRPQQEQQHDIDKVPFLFRFVGACFLTPSWRSCRWMKGRSCYPCCFFVGRHDVVFVCLC